MTATRAQLAALHAERDRLRRRWATNRRAEAMAWARAARGGVGAMAALEHLIWLRDQRAWLRLEFGALAEVASEVLGRPIAIDPEAEAWPAGPN